MLVNLLYILMLIFQHTIILFVIAVNKYLILLIVKILVMKCKNKLNIKLKKLNLFSVVFAKNV